MRKYELIAVKWFWTLILVIGIIGLIVILIV